MPCRATRSECAQHRHDFSFLRQGCTVSWPNQILLGMVSAKSVQDCPKMENCLPIKQQKTQRKVAFFVHKSLHPKKPLKTQTRGLRRSHTRSPTRDILRSFIPYASSFPPGAIPACLEMIAPCPCRKCYILRENSFSGKRNY